MGPGLAQHVAQTAPDRIARGVAHQHPVLDQPGFLAPAERPDGCLDPIFLHVRTAHQQQSTWRNRADGVVLASFDQALPVWRFAFLDPGLAKLGVLERLDGRRRARFLADGRLPRGGDVTPTAPSNRAVERRQMEPGSLSIPIGKHRPPLAVLQHPGLVVLSDRRVARLANVGRRLRCALVPAQLLEPKPLAMTTVRAGHEVAPLIACVVLPLDGARPRDGRGGHDEDLAAREGARARFRQRDRIAFAFDVQRIPIHLVQKQVAHRHRAQAHRAVGTGHHQHATD